MDPAPAIALTLTLAISSVTDIGERRIPNVLTGSAAIVAVLLSVLGISTAPVEAVAVALILGLPLAALAILAPDGFGMGDTKLIAVMALFMGWDVWFPLIAGLGLATVIGAVAGRGRSSGRWSVALPLAPFLAIATVPFLVATAPMLH